MLLDGLTIWIFPTGLRLASERVANLLKLASFDHLFLNLPRRMESLIRALSEGAPYEWFMKRVSDSMVIREPLTSWEYRVQPILKAVRGIMNKRHRLGLWCYKSQRMEELSIRTAEKAARLILRSNLSGKVEVDEWMGMLTRFLEESGKSLKDEARYIAERFEGGIGVCLSDFYGRELGELLIKEGLDARFTYAFKPYHFTPLEVLLREFGRWRLRGLPPLEERVEELVRCHSEFVRDYILTSESYDEAYFRWLRDRVTWLRVR